MKFELLHSGKPLKGELKITGSKSESNRALIIQALYPNIELENLSNSDDTHVLQQALQTSAGIIDIHHAGTAMRFLTAYFASREGSDIILTGSTRMKERPVKLLVEALQNLGAEITYIENPGYPPLKILGKKFKKSYVSVEANISSQYISALMLVAPSLPDGLEIELKGVVTSTPYILMTLELLKSLGINGNFKGNRILIEPADKVASKTIKIESDWSSASYFYSLAGISNNAIITLSNYKESSLQGDCFLKEIYRKFGVTTIFDGDTITLIKKEVTKPKRIIENLQNAPDIAQTIAVTCLALGVECELNGLHTLKIKETDRLMALKTEMEKFGASVKITGDSLKLFPGNVLEKNISVATYNDHRMAMAFAPLALKVPVQIEDAGVVSKSYPDFWEDLEKLGFSALRSSQ